MFLLAMHNLMRWVVVILALVAVVNASLGWSQNRSWSKSDRLIGSFFTISLDIQLLLGLILFFTSGWANQLFTNFGEMMASPSGRFFGFEHVLYMLLAVIFAHVGSARARKASPDRQKFRNALVWYALVIVVLAVGVPWPFFASGRPWFRLPF